MGVEGATRLISDGQKIRVNGTDGYVEILPSTRPAPAVPGAPSAHAPSAVDTERRSRHVARFMGQEIQGQRGHFFGRCRLPPGDARQSALDVTRECP